MVHNDPATPSVGGLAVIRDIRDARQTSPDRESSCRMGLPASLNHFMNTGHNSKRVPRWSQAFPPDSPWSRAIPAAGGRLTIPKAWSIHAKPEPDRRGARWSSSSWVGYPPILDRSGGFRAKLNFSATLGESIPFDIDSQLEYRQSAKAVQ